jgi:hypothetical protein
MSISNLNLTAIDNLIDLEPQIQTLTTSTQIQQVRTGPVMYCYGKVTSDSTEPNGQLVTLIYPNTPINNTMTNLWAQLIPINIPAGAVPNTAGLIEIINFIAPVPVGAIIRNALGGLDYKSLTANDTGITYLVNLIIEN